MPVPLVADVRRELRHVGMRSLERFTAWVSLGWVAVVAGAVGFTILWILVQSAWRPLSAFDQSVSNSLNDLVAGHPLLVEVLRGATDLGGRGFLTVVLAIGTAYLLIRRQIRLAVYVMLTAVGAFVLDPALKLLVGRLRPVVETPVAAAPGMSFPSGHALSSFVSFGVLLLVFLPTVPCRRRSWAVAGFGLVVLLVGFTRVALGVHYPSDVLAGWLLGSAWLAVTAAAFRGWRRETGAAGQPLAEGLAPEVEPALQGEPEPAPREAGRWRPRAARLVVAWVLVLGAAFGAGVLVTALLPADHPVLVADRAAVEWLAAHRSEPWSTLADAATWIGSTALILAATFATAGVAVGVLRRWRPAAFLVVVIAGEVSLFFVGSTVVSRARPAVAQVNPDLPPTASFPSGHVAAAACVYIAVALLVWHANRSAGWRWLALGAAVLIPALVGLARVYRGVHFPTDVLGSLLLAVPWTLAAWWIMDPLDRSHRHRPAPPPLREPPVTVTGQANRRARAGRSPPGTSGPPLAAPRRAR